MTKRKPYLCNVSEEEWTFVAPYLALVRPGAPQRHHELRKVLKELRWVVRTSSPWVLHAARLAAVGGSLPADEAVATGGRFRGDGPRFARTLLSEGRAPDPTAAILDSRTLRPTSENESVELAYVEQGYTGERPASEVGAHGMRFGGSQALGGVAGIRALASPLGLGARFRIGIAIQATGERSREAAHHFGGVTLRRLRMPRPPSGNRNARRGSITSTGKSWYSR